MTDVEAMKDELDGLASDEELAEVVDVVDDRYMVMVRVKVVLSVVEGSAVPSRAWEVLAAEDGADVWLAEEDLVESLGELEVCKAATTSAENVVADGTDCDVRDVVAMTFVDDDTEETIGEEMTNELRPSEAETVAEETATEEPRASDTLTFPEEVVTFVLVGLLLLTASKRSV